MGEEVGGRGGGGEKKEGYFNFYCFNFWETNHPLSIGRSVKSSFKHLTKNRNRF